MFSLGKLAINLAIPTIVVSGHYYLSPKAIASVSFPKTKSQYGYTSIYYLSKNYDKNGADKLVENILLSLEHPFANSN